ncbi:hypothetical protein HII31_05582, partial [Pseudocercospora fuligena]
VTSSLHPRQIAAPGGFVKKRISKGSLARVTRPDLLRKQIAMQSEEFVLLRAALFCSKRQIDLEVTFHLGINDASKLIPGRTPHPASPYISHLHKLRWRSYTGQEMRGTSRALKWRQHAHQAKCSHQSPPDMDRSSSSPHIPTHSQQNPVPSELSAAFLVLSSPDDVPEESPCRSVAEDVSNGSKFDRGSVGSVSFCELSVKKK